MILINPLSQPSTPNALWNHHARRKYDLAIVAAFALAEVRVFGYDLALTDEMSRDTAEIAGAVSWCTHPSGRGHAGTA